jgi:hypothetical protein
MPSRKTKFVKFDVHFVIEFDDKEPFDSVGTVVGPPDIHGFIAAGMKAIGVEKGNIIGGSRFGMNLHWPKGPVVRAEKPEAKVKKGRRKS